MMNRPPINDLETKAGSRYLLVSAVSKRARQLLSQPDKTSDDKALSAAISELCDGQLVITSADDARALETVKNANV